MRTFHYTRLADDNRCAPTAPRGSEEEEEEVQEGQEEGRGKEGGALSRRGQREQRPSGEWATVH